MTIEGSHGRLPRDRRPDLAQRDRRDRRHGARRPPARSRTPGDIACPSLFQIADFDRSAPPHSSAKAAFKARAEVRHYPCDHFDVYAGKPWHDAVVAHQVAFLTRVLG